jgi:hypothetical protein
MAERAGFTLSVVGKAWNAPTSLTFQSSDNERASVILEITDLNGRMPQPFVAVSVVCNGRGTKALIPAATARDLAAQIIAAADLLEAGAASLEAH